MTVRSSGVEGPVIAIVGGVHGDEFYGPATVVAVAKRLQDIEVRGKVILVPNANPFAVGERARSSRRVRGDLNRQFGEIPLAADPVLQSVAEEIWSAHLSRVQVLADIHSGGDHWMLPHVRFTGEPISVLPLVQAMGIEYAMRYRSLPPGLLMSRSRRSGAVAMGIEVGGGHELEEDVLAMITEGIWGLLRYLGVVAGEQIRSRTPSVVSPGVKQRASAPGIFIPSVDVGAVVNRGDSVGEFTTFATLRSGPIYAPTAGTVFSLLKCGPADRGTKLVEIVPPG